MQMSSAFASLLLCLGVVSSFSCLLVSCLRLAFCSLFWCLVFWCLVPPVLRDLRAPNKVEILRTPLPIVVVRLLQMQQGDVLLAFDADRDALVQAPWADAAGAVEALLLDVAC